jgi:hypothetical protein
MRLGILGVHRGGSLSYRVSSGGVSEEAWLQLGCSVNRSSFQGYANTYDKIQSEGRWTVLDAKIGEVQCCLSQAFMSVRGTDASAGTVMMKSSLGTKQTPCVRRKTGDCADGRSSVEITVQVAALLTLLMINVVTT